MCKRIICLLLCLVLLPLTACAPKEEGSEIVCAHPPAPEQLATAKVPKQVTYPSYESFEDHEQYKIAMDAWRAQNKERNLAAQSATHPEQFYRTATATLLSGSEENTVYSPLNLYLALSLLSETTDGESRAQIMSLLQVENIDDLRESTDLLWKANYWDDGTTTEILANALFLNQNYDYRKEVMNNAAEYHHADIFMGIMGQSFFDDEIAEWINSKTKDLLKEQTKSIETEDDDVMLLISTLYFSGKWAQEFAPETNVNDIFHAEEDRWVEYLHQQSNSMRYYDCDGFDAVSRAFETGEQMYLIRPDEGQEIAVLLENEQLFDPVFGKVEPRAGEPEIDLYLPKFDVTYSTKLIPALKTMGVNDVFDNTKANFTPLLENAELYLSDARHDVRVMIDEEGCKAAAVTIMEAKNTGIGLPEVKEVIEFKLDRPFVYVITSSAGDPLFVGVMQDPTK